MENFSGGLKIFLKQATRLQGLADYSTLKCNTFSGDFYLDYNLFLFHMGIWWASAKSTPSQSSGIGILGIKLVFSEYLMLHFFF